MNKTMKIILATNNKNKLREMREITRGMDIEIISQGDAGISIDPEETGSTFAENAYIKAKAALDATGLPAIYLEASEPPLCGHSSPGASVFFQHGDLQVVERD